MALEGYLAGEVAEDFADGLISRREALRRLGLYGLGAAAAAQLLAACGGGDEGATSSPSTSAVAGASTPGSAGSAPAAGGTVPAGLPSEEIRFPGTSGELLGVFAASPQPKGALLVVHENRGLTPHFRSLVGRFAADGYTSLVVDLLSPEGGTDALQDPAAAPAALSGAPIDRLLGDLRAGIDELERRAPGPQVGAIGFCFGGGMVWNLLNTGEPRLAAASPFYGPAPEGADFSRSRAAVFGVFAENDARVNASRDAAKAALERAGLTHEIKTYAGADHAFFNETGQRYHEAAATEAYGDVMRWFGRYLV